MKSTNAKLSEQFVKFIDLTDKDLEEINVPELGRIQGGWGFSCGSCRGFSCGSCRGFSCRWGFSCEGDWGFSCEDDWGFSCGWDF